MQLWSVPHFSLSLPTQERVSLIPGLEKCGIDFETIT